MERRLKINEDVLRYLTIRVDELPKDPSPILAKREERKRRDGGRDFGGRDGGGFGGRDRDGGGFGGRDRDRRDDD